jgi:hypothetical protein
MINIPRLIALSLLNGCVAACAVAAAPEAKYLFPAGAARGTTLEVAAAGNMGGWPALAWISRPGVSVSAAAEQGKFSVTVAPEAVPGVYWIRLYNAEGAATPLPFVVGTLPEVNEQEPNDNAAKAQALPASSLVVNGRLEKRGDVDTFAVSLTKGQTLVASVAAHETLGSPMDAVLQVVSARGSVLAQNDDQRGVDPLLAFTPPAEGVYHVRTFAFPSTPDASISFAGGENFIYRLTLTTLGLLDGALPLAVTRGEAATVEACGWNLADADKRRTLEPPTGDSIELFSPQWAGSIALPVVPHRSLVEVEPNDAAHAQSLELPATMTGRIGEPRDLDAYRFRLAKGEAWQFKVESRALGYPLDAVLELFDAAGKSLARADDLGGNVDAELKYTAPADGDYTLIVSDLYKHGGPRYLYRLTAAPLAADFAVSVPAHGYVLEIGKPLEIVLNIDRRHNFAGEIDFQVMGLPPGVTLAPAKSAATGDRAQTVKLSLTAAAGAFSGPIRIVGASTAPAAISRMAEASLPAGNERTTNFWLTVK